MVRRGRRLMNINIHVENMVNTYIYNRTNIQKINLFFGGRHSYEVPRIPQEMLRAHAKELYDKKRIDI